ncbi:MAG: DUF1704 domain-containing protein [Polyangiaceae bacterium]
MTPRDGSRQDRSNVASRAQSERDQLVEQLIDVSREVRLLAAVTPTNWQQQLELLLLRASRGQIARPSFSYSRTPSMRSELLRLDSIRTRAEKLGDMGSTIAEAAAEKHLECRLIDAVNTLSFTSLAALRYTSLAEHDEQALEWATELAPGEVESQPETFITGDINTPQSLLNVVRMSLEKRGLPIRVEVRPDLVPLAATGDGVVYITSSRRISYRDARRTALHEIDGHVLPLLHRKALRLDGFRRAGEADREEGLALRIEERAGFLDQRRKHELALRHLAACLAHERVEFTDIVGHLREHGAPLSSCVLIAARAVRGGGLGRERVYLPAYFSST